MIQLKSNYGVVVFFTYSFDKTMAHHPDNADDYREIKQLLPRLIPLIEGLAHTIYVLLLDQCDQDAFCRLYDLFSTP